MIKLSKRLQVIANFVETTDVVVDIGCDHGLLGIYLVNQNIKVIASDVNNNALNQLRKNMEKYKTNIDLRLGYGLDTIKNGEVNTVVLAGMGTDTMVDILSKDKTKIKGINKLITQSNRDNEVLRRYICKLGFYIDRESVVNEGNHFYTIIKFVKGKRFYSKKDYYLGPFLRRNITQEYVAMLEYLYQNNLKLIQQIANQQLKQVIKKKIKWIYKTISKNDN